MSAIPVEQLKEVLLASIGQLRDFQCDAKKAGSHVEVTGEITVRVKVIAPNGLNQLERTTVQTDSGRESSATTPDATETVVNGIIESTSVTDGFTSESIQTKRDGIATSTQTQQPRTTETVRTGTVEEIISTEEQTAQQIASAGLSGGNEVTRENNYESI